MFKFGLFHCFAYLFQIYLQHRCIQIKPIKVMIALSIIYEDYQGFLRTDHYLVLNLFSYKSQLVIMLKFTNT